MAGEAISGITPYSYGTWPLYNNYANGVMLDDIFGGYSSFTTPNMFSMDGSLFGGTGYGATPFMPYVGGGMNYEQYYKNMEQYRDFMYDSQLRQAQKSRQVDFRANSPMESIQRQANILHEKIMQNEQQQIIPALNKFIQSIKSASGYENASNEELIARAETLYSQLYKTTLTEDIRKYGNGSFKQGLFQSLSLGFADRVTAEENVAKINNAPVSRWESAKKVTGNAVGGALIGAGSLFGLMSLPVFKKVFTSKPGFLAGVGAIVGALAGMTMSAISKSPVIGGETAKDEKKA